MLMLTVVNGMTLLVFQIAAYREHHHKSFLLLTLSTIAAFSSLALASAPRFFEDLRTVTAALLVGATTLYAIYMFLGIWGVASLFKSYRALRNAA